MSISKIALAFPLALGIACSTSGAQSREHSAAAALPASGESSSELSVQNTAGTDQTGSSGSMGSQGSSGSMGSGSSGSSDSSSGSGAGSTSGSAAGSGGQGSTQEPGSHMGSGGSSETMGSGEKDTQQQGAAGSSDQAQQGAQAGAGNAGAHAGADQVAGKITKISKDEVSIAPKSGQPKTLKLNDATTVSVNGKDAKWKQLKKGQSVRASYENVNGEDVAVKIESGGMRHGRQKPGSSGGSGSAGESGSSSGGGSR